MQKQYQKIDYLENKLLDKNKNLNMPFDESNNHSNDYKERLNPLEEPNKVELSYDGDNFIVHRSYDVEWAYTDIFKDWIIKLNKTMFDVIGEKFNGIDVIHEDGSTKFILLLEFPSFEAMEFKVDFNYIFFFFIAGVQCEGVITLF